MPGPVQADGLFFACAKSKVKSTHKGKPPYGSPAPPDKRSCSGLICTLGCPQTVVGDVQRCCTLPFLRGVPQAAPGCGVSAPARRVPFRMHEKGPKVHIRGVPLMYPPEGCPPLAGWKGHACHSPPRPVFCPGRPRPLDPGCAAKPHYTVPDRAGAQGLPGRGIRGGGTAPSPVRQTEGASRP